jgi:V/A-type H+-transporting ATPase subunit K
MNKKALFVFVLLFVSAALFAQEEGENASDAGWKYLAAGVAVGLACLGGGIAVGRVGAATIGAMSENPEMSGKAMPYVGLAEGICLWGFLVALLILFL